MLKFLVKNLLGNMPLVPTNKLFKSPSGLIFECCGIARAVPIVIDKTEVHLDFHIYAILEFELLIGHPLENLFQEKPSQWSLNDPFEEVKFISSFVLPRISSETERPSPTSLEPKPCPSGHQSVALNSGRDSMLILHDISLKNKKFLYHGQSSSTDSRDKEGFC